MAKTSSGKRSEWRSRAAREATPPVAEYHAVPRDEDGPIRIALEMRSAANRDRTKDAGTRAALAGWADRLGEWMNRQPAAPAPPAGETAREKDPMVRMVCPHCGDHAHQRASEWDLSDSGTTFPCSACGRRVTLLLCTSDEYVNAVAAVAAREGLAALVEQWKRRASVNWAAAIRDGREGYTTQADRERATADALSECADALAAWLAQEPK